MTDEEYSRLASRDGFPRPRPPRRTGSARIYNADDNDNDNDNNNDNYNDDDNDNDNDNNNNDNNNDDDNDTNINHKGLQRIANEYAEGRRIYKDLISQIEK